MNALVVYAQALKKGHSEVKRQVQVATGIKKTQCVEKIVAREVSEVTASAVEL